jgi:hypothetical protein
MGLLYVASRWSANDPDTFRLRLLGVVNVTTSALFTVLTKTLVPAQHWPYLFAAAWCGLFIAFSGEPNPGVTRPVLNMFNYLIFPVVWSMVISSIYGSDPADTDIEAKAISIYIPLCWSVWQVAFRLVFRYAPKFPQGRGNADPTMNGTEMGLLGQGQDGEDGEALEDEEEGEAEDGNGDEHRSNNLDDNEVAPAASQSGGLHWNIHELPVGGLLIDANEYSAEQPINDEHDPQAIAAINEHFITNELQAIADAQPTSSEPAVVTNATAQTTSDTQLATTQAAEKQSPVDGGTATVAMATYSEDS